MRVCAPTTAAQYFHLLRRQMRDAERIPLVLMTPKSMLRHPRTVSRPRDLAEGAFEHVLDDTQIADKRSVRRVILCSGKVYYDLLAERDRRKSPHIAIVRLEQLYPFPEIALAQTVASYERAEQVFWVQEEAQNMGAWNFVQQRLAPALAAAHSLRYVGRPESASPATGSLKTHRQQQAALVNAAFE
jgi:2-oxoglutarate dehydrogenase E1 component